MLRARLQREVGTEGLATLYTCASSWYEQNGMPAEAIEAALAASDFGRAARLIDEPLAKSMLLSVQAATLRRWLECFPKEVLLSQAFLCLVYAYSLFASETPEAHEGPLAVAEQLFRAEGNRKGLGQVDTLRAYAASVRGDGAQALGYGTQAFQLLPADALLERSIATSALAEGYRLCGEVMSARRVLTEARPLREQTGNVPSILADTIALGDLLIMQAKLHEAANIFGSVLESADERQSFNSIACRVQALIGLGKIACERNELDTAEEYLEQAVALASKIRDTLRLAHASLMYARIIQAHGDAERTREAWVAALGLAQACSSPSLGEQIQAYQVRGWLKLGRMDDVIRWQQVSPLAHDAPPNFQQEVLALTLVRVLRTGA